MKKQDPAALRAAFLAAQAKRRAEEARKQAAADAWRCAHVCNFARSSNIGV